MKNYRSKFAKELYGSIKDVLPKNWTISHIDSKKKFFIVECPIEDRMNVAWETYHRKIRKIEKATNSENTGGGCFIGGDTYDNDFQVL